MSDTLYVYTDNFWKVTDFKIDSLVVLIICNTNILLSVEILKNFFMIVNESKIKKFKLFQSIDNNWYIKLTVNETFTEVDFSWWESRYCFKLKKKTDHQQRREN